MGKSPKPPLEKTIGETIIEYRLWKHDSSCEEILEYIKKNFKGCSTTIGSVASTLSKACKRLKNDVLFPGRMTRPDDEDDNVEKYDINAADEPEEDPETEAEAKERIMLRYEAMERLAPKTFNQKMTSLFISGPPGLSKSWTIKLAAEASGRQRHDGEKNVNGGGPTLIDGIEHAGYYDWISGGCSEVGLYIALWNMRKGGTIVFDDCDGIFRDEDSVNLLKIATDTTKERLVSWRKNATWLEEKGIDKTFDFKGTIIFLTNIDFEKTIQAEGKMAEHYKAIIDRAAYICLTVRTARDFLIVLKEKACGKHGFLHQAPYNFDDKKIKTLFSFIEDHQRDFYNLSLRLCGQLAIQMNEDPDNWQKDAKATKMKTLMR